MLNTIVNFLGLSLSLTACVLITIYVRYELSFDQHIKDKDRIFRIAGVYGTDERNESPYTSYLLQPIVEGEVSGIERMTRLIFTSEVVAVGANRFEAQEVIFADSSFFDVFGFDIVSGNATKALDDPGSVVLAEPEAIKLFGTADALGKIIEVRGATFVVSAVIRQIPNNTHFTGSIILPMPGVRSWLPDWVLTNITGRSVYTYLKANKDFDKGDFERNLSKLVAARWPVDGPPEFFVQPVGSIHLDSHLEGEIRSNGSRTSVYVFLVTGLVILMLACINYVNLSTAGALQRMRAAGMKRVLGSTRRALFGQFLIESNMMSLTGAACALVLAVLLMPFFNYLSGQHFGLDLIGQPIILVGLPITALLVGCIAGAFPASILAGMGTLSMIYGKFGLKGNTYRLRNGLILFQFAVSVTVIAITLIVAKQFRFMNNKDLGVDPDSVILVRLPTIEIAGRYDVLRTAFLTDPSIVAVSGSNNKVTAIVSTGRPYILDWTKEDVSIPSVTVTHEFFETMKAEIVSGRSFSRDISSDIDEAYVINESAVNMLGPGDAVGKKLFGFTYTGSEWFEKNARVIGVVKDFHFASLHARVQPTDRKSVV